MASQLEAQQAEASQMKEKLEAEKTVLQEEKSVLETSVEALEAQVCKTIAFVLFRFHDPTWSPSKAEIYNMHSCIVNCVSSWINIIHIAL